jgi:hypothetical protein
MPNIHYAQASFSGEGGLTAEAVVVVVSSIAELRQAIKEQRPEIVYELPDWFKVLPSKVLQAMLSLAVLALAFGYNVEYCPKIVVKGVELSFCMKLTKPSLESRDPEERHSSH